MQKRRVELKEYIEDDVPQGTFTVEIWELSGYRTYELVDAVHNLTAAEVEAELLTALTALDA